MRRPDFRGAASYSNLTTKLSGHLGPQLTALFTSAAIFASSAAVNSFSA
jgi:hypothetical protein